MSLGYLWGNGAGAGIVVLPIAITAIFGRAVYLGVVGEKNKTILILGLDFALPHQ